MSSNPLPNDPIILAAEEISQGDPCASCGHVIRVGGINMSLRSLPWACGRTGGHAVKRCEYFTTETPDYKFDHLEPEIPWYNRN